MAEGNDPSNSNPGGGIDTGTGGFPVGGSNQRLSFDVGTEEDSSLDRSTWNQGDIKVDNTKKDISRSTKSTLAAYLSDTTLGNTPSSPNGSKNKYPIDHANGNDPTELTLTDKDGYASDPDVALNNYIKDKVYAGQPDDLKSLTSKSDLAKDLKVVKGNQNPSTKKFGTGANATPIDGNILLKDSTTKDELGRTVLSDKNPVKQYYSNSITNNRFNPESNQYADYFFNDTTNANDLDISPDDLQRLRQEQFALKYEKGTSAADRNLSFGKLAQIGVALSTRAGLEFVDDIPDPTGPDASAAALLPGLAQLGVSRVERESLNARRVLEEIISNGESIEENVLINPLGRSWGALNNPLDEFSGMSNFGMQLLAAALVTGMVVTVGLFTALIPGSPNNDDSKIEYEDERRPYGAYNAQDSTDYGNLLAIIDRIVSGKFSFLSLIGIKPTKNSLDQCIRAGALASIGLSNPPPVGGDTAQINIAVTQSPGYYVILARSITRSFLQIGDAFVKLGRAFNSGNVTEGIKQIFSLVQTLRDSKFVGVIGVFAALGDRIVGLQSANSTFYTDSKSRGFTRRFKSRIDLEPDTSGGKGRIKDPGKYGQSTLKLAWASSTSKFTMIAPPRDKLSYTVSDLGMPSLFAAGTPGTGRDNYPIIANSDDKNRISTGVREQLEKDLEAEYVPFYMHDVRTNEVLGFHAFLTSLTDDYSVNYDSVDGFGRVEPVKVYKGTTRKIGVSFIIASTSKDDHDVMWLKINKLVTMIYPQFTEGRKLISGGYKIYAPFSQTISASPLIRLRIGDLIKSNYSKFNLARIFGYTYKDTQFAAPSSAMPAVNPAPSQSSPVTTADWNKLSREEQDRLANESFKKNRETQRKIDAEQRSLFETRRNLYSEGNTFTSSAKLATPATSVDAALIAAGSPAIKQAASGIGKNVGSVDPELTLPKGYVFKIVTKKDFYGKPVPFDKDTTHVFCVVQRAQGEDIPDSPVDPDTYDFYEGGGGPQNLIAGRYFYVPISQLTPTNSTRKKQPPTPPDVVTTPVTQGSPEAAKPPQKDELSNVSAFMNDDENSTSGNAIVRSFKSSGGKGLAGFIDSLSFDWYDGVTWDTDRNHGDNKVAPMMCKVTISFTPIHDITPGLDHMGANRAPVYPVGPNAPYQAKKV